MLKPRPAFLYARDAAGRLAAAGMASPSRA